MNRRQDLERSIRESYDLIREYESIIRTSDRPEEKLRARRVIGEQRALIQEYQAELALGGDDICLYIVDWICEEFKRDVGIDLRRDRMALVRLSEAAEAARIELSTAMEVEINLPFITADASGPKHLQMTLSRARLRQLTIAQRIADWICDEFERDQGIDLRQDLQAMQRVRDAAEVARIKLSTATEAEINLPFLTADVNGVKHLQTTLARARLRQLTGDLIERTEPDALSESETAAAARTAIDPSLGGHVFISYSHDDGAYAHQLEASLLERSFTVWIDDRIDYGARWPLVIEESLDACAALILLMSPRARGSNWVQNELARAQAKRKPILPLLLEGDCWLAVQATQYVDVRGSELPPEPFYERLRQVIDSGRDGAASTV